jgi:protein TonB
MHDQPPYPAEATEKGIEGKVVLDAVIARDGTVLEVSVRSGDPVLAAPALESARDWLFRPTKLNGQPVEVATTIEFTFTLPDRVVSA